MSKSIEHKLNLSTLALSLADSTLNDYYTMFDFEKLTVYSHAKDFNKKVNHFLVSNKQDRTTTDQLRRASFSIMLNIAEGSGRYTQKDKRNFYVISRGSAFECVAIFDYLKDIGTITESEFAKFYSDLDEISRMLFSMIKHLS
ncbi:four helix bundle protein [Saccharicrinis sp. FJH2]|uniref:four helix bundle protein n=2 Tax=Saccharicrinis sp. FJH65 TaxID=3344659 RepID=UPI0035F4DA3F